MLRIEQLGYAGAAPELRYTTTGVAVAKVRVGTTERWKSGDGELKERTTWVYWEVWGESAENMAKLVKKGSLLFVDGGMRNDSWEDKEGKTQYRDRHVVSMWRLLDRKPKSGEGTDAGDMGGGGFTGNGAVPAADDEIPF